MLSKLFAVENIQGDPFVSLMVLGNWCLKGHSECTSAIKKKKNIQPLRYASVREWGEGKN